MLFGPVRSYPECAAAYKSMHLHAVIDSKPTSNRVGVYVCDMDTAGIGVMAEVFSQRHCTPTTALLYPGYTFGTVDEQSMQELCAADRLIVNNVLSIKPQVQAFDTVARPPVPDGPAQGDLSRAAAGNKRRIARLRQPGVQPSALDWQEDAEVHYPEGTHVPRVKDPEELFRSLFPAEDLPNPEELRQLQLVDEQCQALARLAAGEIEVDPNPRIAKLLRSVRGQSFVVQDGIVFHNDEWGAHESSGSPRLRVVLPMASRQAFLTACHDGLGHPGIARTLQACRARVYWPGLRTQVKQFIHNCPTCLFNKVTPHRGEQQIPGNGTHPWHSVQMDIVHLHKAKSGMEKALVFYDRFTRDVEAFAVPADCGTEEVLNILLFEIRPRHGFPRVLYTDRGSNLISEKAQNFYMVMGIELRAADAEMHTGVAGAERFNATLRELARATHFDHGWEWDVVLPLLISWYKDLVQTATGYTPFFLNHGRDSVAGPWDLKNGPRFGADSDDAYVKQQFAILHLAWQCAQSAIAEREKRQKGGHDQRYQTNVQFKKGDRVLIRQAGRLSKMDMPHVGPFRVEELLERDRYRLVGRQGAKHLHHDFHISRLKLWPEGADLEEVYMDSSYFDAEAIVAHRTNVNGEVMFRVRWVGYTAADDTWEPFSNLNAALGREALEYMLEFDSLAIPNLDEYVAVAPQPSEHAPPAAATPVIAPADDIVELAPTQLQLREARLEARRKRMGE